MFMNLRRFGSGADGGSARQISAYGVVDAELVSDKGSREQPIPHPQYGGEAESCRCAFQSGDHWPLHSDSGNFPCIESIEPGSGGEIQLTDALKYMLRNRPIYGLKFEGKRYDAGDKLGFLKAQWSSL